MPEITVRQLSQTFGANKVLDQVDFTVPQGAFVTLLGPSGCGKTTTLMSIAGFQTPDHGAIAHGDRTLFESTSRTNLPAEHRGLGVVFQSYALWPHLTVAQNVGFPLKIRKADKKQIAGRVRAVLELVELAHRADAYPHELSGGQQQRVALARALAHGPSALLLDEPFSNLDAKLRDRAREWLRDLQRALGITTVFVTHDQNEALAMSDRILVMNGGRIIRAGTPEDVYQRPGSRFVAEFLGRCNFVQGATRHLEGSTWLLEAPHLPGGIPFRHEGDPGPDPVTLSLRPEHLLLADSDEAGPATIAAGWHAEVTHTTFLGDHYLYNLRLGPHDLQALSPRRLHAATVRVTVVPGTATPVTDEPLPDHLESASTPEADTLFDNVL
ncbi:ABC transporter ATP-binding protein [Streptomyces sp. NPDC052036]|uniref:ABC transporter ATP-binding protein n=1 Tax=Streptomyces sp. NPDC052036 TaxID=3155171 RepID=UPI0034493D08